ncbi:MAG: AsmA-like C-terminal region-containing protein [Bacteroidota bacterium]
MKKKWKYLAGIFLVLLAVLISLPFIFKNKLVAKGIEQVNQSLDATFHFGDFDLGLIGSFPYLNFSVTDLSLIGKNDFEGDTLLFTKKLSLRVNLMSVLKGGPYEVKRIILDEPVIRALVNKQGKANWEITKPGAEAAAEGEKAKFNLSLKSLEINNADLLYSDDQLGISAHLKGCTHQLKGDFTQDEFDMATHTDIAALTLKYGGVAWLNKVKTTADIMLLANMPAMKFTFTQNKVFLNALELQADGWVEMPKDDIRTDIKLTCPQTDFSAFLSLVPGCYTSSFADVTTKGKLALDAFIKGTMSATQNPAFGLRLLVNNAMFKYPSLPGTVDKIGIDLQIQNPDGVPDRTVIQLKSLHAEFNGNAADMKLMMRTPVSDPFIDASIKGNLNLGEMKKYVPLENSELSGMLSADVQMKGNKSSIDKKQYERFDARGNIRIQNMQYKSQDFPAGFAINEAEMQFTPAEARLLRFVSRLGKSSLEASGNINNLIGYAMKDELLSGTFTVSSPFLDVNEFMTGKTAAETAADTGSLQVIPVPSNLDFTLRGSFARLLYSNMDMRDVNGIIMVKNSELMLSNLGMQMLGGSMLMNGKYVTRNIHAPLVDFAMQLKGMDIAQTAKTFLTIQKLAPVVRHAGGNFDCGISFSGILEKNMSPKLNTLSGSGNLATKQVVVTNLPMFIRVADVLKMPEYKQVNLNDIKVAFAFSNGEVKIEPFDFKIRNSTFRLGGKQGFDQKIDYQLDANLSMADLGSRAGALANAAVNFANAKGASFSVGESIKAGVKIGGTFTNPQLKTDFAETTGSLKDKAKELIDKTRAELEAKVRTEADKKKAEAEALLKAETEKRRAEAEAKLKAEEARIKAELEKQKSEAENRAKAEAEKAAREAKEKAKKEAEKKIKGLFGK